MNKFSLAAAIAIAVGMAAPAAQAADGNIEFTGAVIGVTCIINGGDKDLSVVLPRVSTAALADVGAEAGRTPFIIQLTGCDAGVGKVSTYFEGDSHVDANTGYLNIDAGGAENVQISLLNDTYGEIKVGALQNEQNSQQVMVNAGSATLNYFAQYKSQGAAGAGDVRTRVRYTISYE